MFNVLQLHVLRNIMGGLNNATGGQEKEGERKGEKWGQTHRGDN